VEKNVRLIKKPISSKHEWVGFKVNKSNMGANRFKWRSEEIPGERKIKTVPLSTIVDGVRYSIELKATNATRSS